MTNQEHAEKVADALARLAESFEGWGFHESSREGWLELLAPVDVYERPTDEELGQLLKSLGAVGVITGRASSALRWWRESMGGQASTCGLFVRGLWYRLGVRQPELGPYRIGRAIDDVVKVAQRFGALTTDAEPPQRGDVFLIDGPQHVGVVLACEPNGSNLWAMRSIDGGQRDEAGLQCALERRRVLMRIRGRMVVAEPRWANFQAIVRTRRMADAFAL